MKKIILSFLFLSFSLHALAEKNIRVNFRNQRIEVLPIKAHTGKATLTLENSSFKNFTLRLMKNDQPLQYIKLAMSSTQTVDVDLKASDRLHLVPYDPSMKMLNLVSSD